jgi:glycerate dehydrogenase
MRKISVRIVVLDGYTINPGDLSWEHLQALGHVEIFDRTPPERVLERSQNAEILLTNKTVLDKAAIEALPALRYIGVLATGYNVVAVDTARSRHIVVTNVPAYGTASVVQATFALLLELTNQVGYYSHTVHDGQWTQSADFCYVDRPLIELHGLTFGIVGFGSIGHAVANLAHAFGMKVMVYSRSKSIATQYPNIQVCDLDTLFTNADIVSLHCPLTEETRSIVNAKRLAQMKPSALLINTGRGPLIDETALADALKSGRIAGAGLDVLSVEPPRNGNPLFNCPNCIITPHIAWATKAARQRLLDTAVHNLRAFLSGSPVHVVGHL